MCASGAMYYQRLKISIFRTKPPGKELLLVGSASRIDNNENKKIRKVMRTQTVFGLVKFTYIQLSLKKTQMNYNFHKLYIELKYTDIVYCKSGHYPGCKVRFLSSNNTCGYSFNTWMLDLPN